MKCLHFPSSLISFGFHCKDSGYHGVEDCIVFQPYKILPTKYLLGIVMLLSLYSHSYSSVYIEKAAAAVLCHVLGCFLPRVSILWTPHWWVMPFQHWFVASCILGVAWLYSTNSEKFLASVVKCGLAFFITTSSYLLQAEVLLPLHSGCSHLTHSQLFWCYFFCL